jgi:LysR family transcriptional regulator for bpeEF and oprC
MDRLEAMRLFTRVAETGSFSAVARETGIGQPAVSKQIAGLEAHLGVQLLHRTSRSLSLTEAGQNYYEAVVKLLDDMTAAEQSAGLGQTLPTGLLRVTVAAGFGRLRIVPLLPGFHARYPGIVIDLIVSDRFVDLVEEGIDIAIRIGELSDSAMIARRIGISPTVTVAAPAYLARAGRPAAPDDLEQHDRVVFTFQGSPRPWTFNGPGWRVTHIPKGPVRANDAEHVRAAVLAGIGIAQTPRWLFAEELASGAVLEVLADLPSDTTPIHAVYPAGRRPPGKVRVFIDHLAEAFAADPGLRTNRSPRGQE